MIQLLRTAHWSGYAIGALLGAFVAFAVAPTVPTWGALFWRTFDAVFPVSEVHAERVIRQDGEIRATLLVRRFRGACSFRHAAAFQEAPGIPAIRVGAERVDGKQVVNIPGGMDVLAEWRFWPVIDGGRLRVVMEYVCDGRPVNVEVKGL